MNKDLQITKGQKVYLKKIINELKVQFESLVQDATLQMQKINDFHSTLLISSEDRSSIEDQIKQIESKLKEILHNQQNTLNEMNKFYNEIFIGEEADDIPSKKQEINDFFAQINKELEEIDQKKLKISTYFGELFGEKDTNGVYCGGLQQELEKKNNEYKELNQKIESLLPGATSAGLAYAYEKQRGTYKNPQRIWSIVFGFSIFSMIIVLLCYDPNLGVVNNALRNLFFKFLFRLAIISPLVWLATFASKQQSKLQRLEQEYAHKEALSRSFDGYNREIRRIDNNTKSEELLMQLLKNVIDMSGYNPSITLDNPSHESKNPVSTTIEHIAEKGITAVPNLKS